jgi:pimeloyl-ACP methyl ester carboxylesterase
MNLTNNTEKILGFEIFGDGAEKVIVLHDWFGEASAWNLIKPYLATDIFTFVFADARGYGKSVELAGEYSTAEIAGDIIRLADFLDFETFHLIGHSMTGMAAQKLAISDETAERKRLKSLIAVTPVAAGGLPLDRETIDTFHRTVHDRKLTEQALMALTGNRLLESWSGNIAAKNLASTRADAMRGYLQMILEENFHEAGKKAGPKVPTLVIGGDHDLPFFQKDRYAESFSPIFSELEIIFIKEAGHYPMFETPVLLATLIQNHLQKNI